MFYIHLPWESQSDGNGPFGIIFQLNNLYFLPWCTPASVAIWNEVCLWICACMRKRGGEPGEGQSVARDPTPQPNNIHNIHQIFIYYLTGILSILQMCMCVCVCIWEGPACKVSVLSLTLPNAYKGSTEFYVWKCKCISGKEALLCRGCARLDKVTVQKL